MSKKFARPTILYRTGVEVGHFCEPARLPDACPEGFFGPENKLPGKEVIPVRTQKIDAGE
jgi:hypothetical protein